MNNGTPDQETARFNKESLYRLLNETFRLLIHRACGYASRSREIRRSPLEKVARAIFSWVDCRLRRLGRAVPNENLKEGLFREFLVLQKNQEKFPLTDPEPEHCPVCGTRLTTAYDQPLVCERCLQPVLDALDALVRGTDTEWTPEELRERYLALLALGPED